MNDLVHQRRGGGAHSPGEPARRDGGAAESLRGRHQHHPYDLIELFFFAYRDFVGDADRLLESLRFGRAHHRVLHFVDRHPGLTIAELLDILRITKQSLNRVLKELLDQGYVKSSPGATDRRQRQLTLTEQGRALANALADLQSQRFARALEELPGGAREGAVRFLLAMIDPEERPRVEALVWGEGRHEP
ncbi:MAG: marR [Hyphomicrobiales bacterium]|nr:marR [Hyphomicrobiales bacterium]